MTNQRIGNEVLATQKKTFHVTEKCGLGKNTYTNTLLLLKMGR